MVLAKYWAASLDKEVVLLSGAGGVLNDCPLEKLTKHKQVKQSDGFGLKKRSISRPQIKGEASLINLCSWLFCQREEMNICNQTGKVQSV